MSNSRVDLNLEGMERFISELKSLATDLKERRSRLNNYIQALSLVWRDDEARRFIDDFHRFQRLIDSGISDLDGAHIPFLIRKLQRARDFINQR